MGRFNNIRNRNTAANWRLVGVFAWHKLRGHNVYFGWINDILTGVPCFSCGKRWLPKVPGSLPIEIEL